MPKRKPRKPYKGILEIQAPKYSSPSQWTHDVVLPKLRALLDHYEIPHGHHDRWFFLAVNLALDHVPGFVPVRPGRKVEPKGLINDINLLLQLGRAELLGESVNNAARLLTREKTGLFKGQNSGTLRDRYYLLKDPASPEGKRVRQIIEHFENQGFHHKRWGEHAGVYMDLLAYTLGQLK